MDQIDYGSAFRKSKELMDLFNEKQPEWLQRILFLSVTLFGILISLHSTAATGQYTRLAFAASLVSLALGILLLAIALYGHIDNLKRIRKKYAEEAANAIHERRKVGPVSVLPRKRYTFCEGAAYIFLSLSIILLVAYAIMTMF